MNKEYYVLDGDSFNALYEVDREAGLIKMVGSKIGTFTACQWPLRDYLPERFVPVDVLVKDGETIVSRRDKGPNDV